MSCVSSEVFTHTADKKMYDGETDSDFSYKTSQTLKTSCMDDKFHVCGVYSSAMQGTVSTSISLTFEEAKRLKSQLDEFIEVNWMNSF